MQDTQPFLHLYCPYKYIYVSLIFDALNRSRRGALQAKYQVECDWKDVIKITLWQVNYIMNMGWSSHIFSRLNLLLDWVWSLSSLDSLTDRLTWCISGRWWCLLKSCLCWCCLASWCLGKLLRLIGDSLQLGSSFMTTFRQLDNRLECFCHS